jgi:hypothetical protein
VKVSAFQRFVTYPRFPGDVDPNEPHPIAVLNVVRELNWSVRPSPRTWLVHEGGGSLPRYAVHFDDMHRFSLADGQGHVFKPVGPAGRFRAEMLRTFLDHMLANHNRSPVFTSATWLVPDALFRVRKEVVP